MDIVDASNTARFPENQAPSTVNDGARALEGILARFHEDLGCRKASTGSANAYVFAAAQTLSAYYDGQLIGFDANFANTGAATLNVDAIGAKTIKKLNDQDLVSGDIEAGQKVLAIYDGTNFQLLSPTARGGSPITTRGDVVRGSSAGAPERLAIGAANTVLHSDGTDAAWSAAGKILQTAITVDTTNRSTTNTSYEGSSVSVILGSDLRDTSSKVRIRVYGAAGASATLIGSLTVHDGSGALTPAGVNGFTEISVFSTAQLTQLHNFAFEFEDSPASTTPKTYTLQFKTSAGTFYLGRRGNDTSIDAPTIMVAEEIAV